MTHSPQQSRTALVLGGGGSTGNAWLSGVVAGLFEAGVDVTRADLIVGTSAGATAAAQITGAAPLELLANILGAPARPVGAAPGRPPGSPVVNHTEKTAAIIGASSNLADRRCRTGAAALEVDGSEGEWTAQWRVRSHLGCRAAGLAAATAQVDTLRAQGSAVETIYPEAEFEHLFGPNGMDLSLRPAAARAGHDQGKARGAQLAGFWR